MGIIAKVDAASVKYIFPINSEIIYVGGKQLNVFQKYEGTLIPFWDLRPCVW